MTAIGARKLRTTREPKQVEADTVREALRQARFAITAETLTSGTWGRTVSQRLDDFLEAADYGVVGDSFTDDTVAAQAALTAGAAENKPVHFRNLVVRISAGLTCAGPGLDFDSVPHGVSQGPGFYTSGTGYTSLTFTGRPQVASFCLYGHGQAVDGVLFSNPQDATVQHVRVYNLNGFGCNLTQMYDCLFGTISVELCGTTSKYAFSILPGADTSNMSHILRLQVEQANAKAIFVDPTTLCCVIDNIHSERLTPNATYTSWQLAGARCIYQGMRLHSSGTSANATLLLSGEHCQYNGVAVEGNIVVKAEGASASAITITDPNIAGTFQNVTNQTGVIEILGGEITTFTADPQGFRVFGTKITTLDVEVGPNPADATQARFVNCDIATLAAPTSALSAATFVACRIGEGNNLLKGLTVLVDCLVTFAGTCTVQGPLFARGTTFVGNLTPNGYAIFDSGCHCTGTVTGPGPPTQATFPGIRGMTSKNLLPAAASDFGWVCTASGGPGTWVALAPGAVAWASITGTPTTLAGYGITDAGVYSEGTWTPAVNFGGGATGLTYSAQAGAYTKTGKLITLQLDVTLSAKGSSTGAATIAGLPFTVAQTVAVDLAFFANVTGFTTKSCVARADASGTSIILAFGNTDPPTQLQDTDFAATTRLVMSLTYRTT